MQLAKARMITIQVLLRLERLKVAEPLQMENGLWYQMEQLNQWLRKWKNVQI